MQSPVKCTTLTLQGSSVAGPPSVILTQILFFYYHVLEMLYSSAFHSYYVSFVYVLPLSLTYQLDNFMGGFSLKQLWLWPVRDIPFVLSIPLSPSGQLKNNLFSTHFLFPHTLPNCWVFAAFVLKSYLHLAFRVKGDVGSLSPTNPVSAMIVRQILGKHCGKSTLVLPKTVQEMDRLEEIPWIASSKKSWSFGHANLFVLPKQKHFW